jgi:hypothetical protein
MPNPYGEADPLRLAKLLWPWVHFYDKQREMIYSVEDNAETIVVAGNQARPDDLHRNGDCHHRTTL